jgi:DNA-directed RNA polymerase subunit M/transcription elongation factor TFIIS
MTMSERQNPPRELVEKLEQLGPEQVVDGYELCPQCDGLSPGIHMDGEKIMHCSTCHDKHAVTVEEADRWRRAVANIYQRREESPTNGGESFRANQESTMASETSEKCPQCGGHTQAFAVMCGPRTPDGDDMKCTTGIQACDLCGGLGIVESAVAERYRRGDAIRKLRVKKWQLTLNQQAHILGISPMLLNDIERGRAEWPTWVNQKLLAEYGYA